MKKFVIALFSLIAFMNRFVIINALTLGFDDIVKMLPFILCMTDMVQQMDLTVCVEIHPNFLIIQ